MTSEPAHLPRHPAVVLGTPHAGTCGSCGCVFWTRKRPIEGGPPGKYQEDRINPDGRLHLVTCLPQDALELLTGEG